MDGTRRGRSFAVLAALLAPLIAGCLGAPVDACVPFAGAGTRASGSGLPAVESELVLHDPPARMFAPEGARVSLLVRTFLGESPPERFLASVRLPENVELLDGEVSMDHPPEDRCASLPLVLRATGPGEVRLEAFVGTLDPHDRVKEHAMDVLLVSGDAVRASADRARSPPDVLLELDAPVGGDVIRVTLRSSTTTPFRIELSPWGGIPLSDPTETAWEGTLHPGETFVAHVRLADAGIGVGGFAAAARFGAGILPGSLYDQVDGVVVRDGMVERSDPRPSQAPPSYARLLVES